MNYTEALAESFRARFPEMTAIYSNVDPAREWNGETSIEFAETDAATDKYITGETRRRLMFAVAVRSETQEEAAGAGKEIRRILKETLTEMENNRVFECWTLEEEGTTPDARGLTVGESFYWFQNFTITEFKTR